MKINLDELNKRREQRLLTCRKHPTEDLYIWNYTPECQYDRKWDEYTKICRGLVLDREGNVIAKAFDKFFNINEAEETKLENLPNEVPIITEKVDGSLGIIFIYKDRLIVATRGSFESEQAAWSTEWLKNNLAKSQYFIKDYTYLFEIIYKANRIVINYDKEELVLLSIINNETSKELSYEEVNEEGKRLNVNIVKKLEINDIKKVIDMLPTLSTNEEGFVCKYSNGLRVKLKGEEYIRLHKLITGVTERRVWEILKNNENRDAFLLAVPEEFRNWFNDTEAKLKEKYMTIEKEAKETFNNTPKFPTRKEYALHFKHYPSYLHGVLFKLLDSAEYDELIWKSIEPKGVVLFKVTQPQQ